LASANPLVQRLAFGIPMKQKPSTKELMDLTQLSRATIDRALNNRPGVHARTRDAIEQALRTIDLRSAAVRKQGKRIADLKLVAQAGAAFTAQLSEQAALLADEFEAAGRRLEVISCSGATDADVAATVSSLADRTDGIAIIGTNTAPITSALRAYIKSGKAVVALVSELAPDARHVYVGIDNRAAGQTAAFLMGRQLQAHPQPNVAVVVGTFAYICHEDREIGFRSLLRQRFPNVNLIEVIKGAESAQATYEATLQFLKQHGTLDGVYNVASGNEGLAEALRKHSLIGKTLFITHELNTVTEPLMKAETIDYLIAQSIPGLLRSAVDRLAAVIGGQQNLPPVHLPIELICRYSLP